MGARFFDRLVWRALAALAIVLLSTSASAQVVDAHLRASVFHEPSQSSSMTVYSPQATIGATPWQWLNLHAGYAADIVSGASEAVKAGPLSNPDIVSAASVHDFRQVYSGGFTITRENTHLGASYAYGTEHDYHSNGITVNAGSNFLENNTQIELSYGRGFDKVCNVAYAATLDPTLREALDSSAGCFTGAADRQSQDVDSDDFQTAWTQTWTPVFATQLVLTGQIQHGFLSSPYRAVVIAADGETAQEHVPDNRARASVAARAKIYVRPLATTFGAGVRYYRDTWDIFSQMYELNVERYLTPGLRLLVRGRFYTQTGALFWSDDYTGGEPKYGPRGQYFTGDRELSPMQTYMVGGRLIATWHGASGSRILGALLDLSVEGSVDLLKTNLDDFTWAGQAPDNTFALIAGVAVDGDF
jgi:Protein of unknown function (DUF3570)